MARLTRIVMTAMSFVVLTALPASAAWNVSTIANNGNSDSQTSNLVISPTGRTFVAWQAQGSDELYWAKRTTTGWKTTTVRGAGTYVGCYSAENDWVGPSATFAPNGTPRIASACAALGGGAKVLFSRVVDGVWKTKTVGYGPSGLCDSSATDIDLINNPNSGRPVIVITDQCTKAATGFFSQGGSWVKQTLAPGGTIQLRYPAIDLAVDPSTGQLAVARISDVFGRGAMYLNEFTWSGAPAAGSDATFSLPNGDTPLGEPSLAFSADGTGFVAFQEATAYGTSTESAYSFLALATRTSGTWSAPVAIDNSVTFTGAEPSLAVTDGGLYVAYQDFVTFDLRYATSLDGSAWSAQTAVAANNTGYYPSLGVTAAGKARIAYYDRTSTALKSSFES